MTQVKTTPLFLNSAQMNLKEHELVDRLREIGLDRMIELPQIVVMGDTSSGKSSLLSALSGVSFPSSDLLTTRCPTQLVLRRGTSFYGHVALHRYASNLHEYEEVLSMIEDVPHSITKLTKVLHEQEGHDISDDAIVITLTGPELPNLTLVDLPGLVRAVSDLEKTSMITRISNMVRRYMNMERTVMIAVVPANVDMHNTEILQAAHEVDPSGARTIAVITKMDLVDAGAEHSVHQLLLNKRKVIRMGYHAVRCRSQKELIEGISIRQGIEREATFFQSHEYWKTLPRELYGISNLSTRLVCILHDQIRQTLPKKKKNALGMPLETREARQFVFYQWVQSYLSRMKCVLKGECESQREINLRALLVARDREFRIAIRETSNQLPCVHSPLIVGELVEIQFGFPENNGKWELFTVDEIGSNGDIVCNEFSSEWIGSSRWRRNEIESLRAFIAANRGDELMIFPSYKVFCNLVSQWTGQWLAPMTNLITQYKVNTLQVSTLLLQGLNMPKRLELFLIERVEEIMEALCTTVTRDLQKILEGERGRPFTQDNQLFDQIHENRHQSLQKRLKTIKADVHGKVTLQQVINQIDDLNLSNEEHELIEMETALKAYIVVATKRFVDVIPMRLHTTMLLEFVKDIGSQLMATTPETLERLMQESESKRTRRAEVEKQLGCLYHAKQEINMLL